MDDGICIEFAAAEAELLPMDKAGSENAISFLCCAPNGVQAMSADIEGLVQTSLNQGILFCDDDCVHIRFSVRSSIESQKYMLINKLRCLTEKLGGSVSVSGVYPGWAYRKDSPLRELLVEVYKEQYGSEPVILAIHAGLECGLLLDKCPDLDCVSLGPQMSDIHTFREKLYIQSTQRTWKLLLETLRRIK